MKKSKMAAAAAVMIATGIIAGGCVKDELAAIARTLDRIEKELSGLEGRGGNPYGERDSSAATGSDSLATEDTTGGHRQDDPPLPPPEKYALYASGVRYEEGFDWKLEQEGAGTKATLFLMKDGEFLVEIPTGLDAMVGTEADMHRILDSHLYSDFATDRYTVLFEDGVQAAIWEGREMIYDILPEGNDVGMLILSGPRSAGGFTLRLPDEVLLHENTLVPVSGFYKDGNDICFNTRDAAGTAVHIISGDQIQVSRLDLPTGNQIAALRKGGHTLTLLSGRKEADSGLYLDEEQLFNIKGKFSRGEILPIGDEIYVLAVEESASTVYDSEGNVKMTVMGCLGVGCLPLGGEPYFLYTGMDDNRPYLYPGGQLSSIGQGYSLSIPYSYASAGSHMAIALETPEGRSAIWHDGKMLDYDFNGPFTHLCLVKKE